MSELWKSFWKWALEKAKHLFKPSPPPQQPFRFILQADELTITGKNISFIVESGIPNSPPQPKVIQISPPKPPEQISDKGE